MLQCYNHLPCIAQDTDLLPATPGAGVPTPLPRLMTVYFAICCSRRYQCDRCFCKIAIGIIYIRHLCNSRSNGLYATSAEKPVVSAAVTVLRSFLLDLFCHHRYTWIQYHSEISITCFCIKTEIPVGPVYSSLAGLCTQIDEYFIAMMQHHHQW